jgi:predicted MFS family arabinose efflux permease
MLAALFSSAVLSGLMGVGTSLVLFLVVRFVAGLASAFAMVFLTTMVFARLAAARREGLGAMHFGGVGVGIAASSLMIGALLLEGSDWRQGWYWAGILSLAGALLVAVLIRPTNGGSDNELREPPLPRSAALTRIILAYGLFGFGYIVTATFLVAIVRQGEGGRMFEAAVWLVTGLAGIPSVWFWNRVARPIGLVPAFAVGCAVEAVGVLASVLLPGAAGPLLGGILLGGTFIALTTIGLVAGRARATLSPRRVLAVMTAAFGIGQILGPIFAGFVADRTGSFTAPSIGAAVALLLCALIAVSVGRQHEH